MQSYYSEYELGEMHEIIWTLRDAYSTINHAKRLETLSDRQRNELLRIMDDLHVIEMEVQDEFYNETGSWQ
jgi:hypothetical protein